MRYRTKPIEAIQWTEDNVDEIEQFMGEPPGPGPILSPSEKWTLVTEKCGWKMGLFLMVGTDGWTWVEPGSWIMRLAGDPSEHWFIKHHYFALAFETIEKEYDE